MDTTIQNVTRFRSTLTAWSNGQVKQRDVLQDCILFGLKQALDHENLTPLSEVVCAVDRVRTIKTDYIKEYIKAHANVRLTKGENDALPWVFKKHGKELKVTMPTVPWFEHHTNKARATADVDGIKSIRAALVKALKAEKEGNLKAGQAATIHKVAELLRDILDPKASTSGDKPALAVVNK